MKLSEIKEESEKLSEALLKFSSQNPSPCEPSLWKVLHTLTTHITILSDGLQALYHDLSAEEPRPSPDNDDSSDIDHPFIVYDSSDPHRPSLYKT
jgi:hypothetical protein